MVYLLKDRKLKFPVSGSGQAKLKILLIEKRCFGRGQGISEFRETEGKGQLFLFCVMAVELFDAC